MKVKFTFFLFILCIQLEAQINISGKVSDSSNVSVEFATVVIKSGTNVIGNAITDDTPYGLFAGLGIGSLNDNQMNTIKGGDANGDGAGGEEAAGRLTWLEIAAIELIVAGQKLELVERLNNKLII